LIDFKVSSRSLAGLGKPNLEHFQFGGQHRSATDNAALSGTGVIGTTEIRKMRGDHILAAPDPRRALINAGDQHPAIRNPAAALARRDRRIVNRPTGGRLLRDDFTRLRGFHEPIFRSILSDCKRNI
jgi:hypothetical protein